MFQQLMPLLAQRVIILTLSRVNAEEICVNVIPRPLKAGEKDENIALATPLSISGTPQELDQHLPQQLVEYVGAHLQLSSTLKTAKEEMEAAAKSAKETARKTATSKLGSSKKATVQGTVPAEPNNSAAGDDPKSDPATTTNDVGVHGPAGLFDESPRA